MILFGIGGIYHRANLASLLYRTQLQQVPPAAAVAPAPSRRISAGLSMRGEYEVEGDHCPRYSQKELDLQVEKAIEGQKAAFDAMVRRGDR